MLCPPHKFRIPTPRPQTDPERKKPIGISAFENIYFTTVVSDNLAIFILVYIRTYDTQITMLKHKIIPSAVTAGMYRSSVVSSVTIHKVLTATSTYIQFKVWSFSNITKYIYVYIIIASQMHLYFDYGGFFVGFFFFVFFFLQSFFLCFQPWVPPHPTSSPHMSPPQPSCAPCTDHRLPSVLWRPTAPSPTNPTCEHYRLSHRPRCANAPFTSPFTPTRREGQKAAFPFLSRRFSPAVPPICLYNRSLPPFPPSATDPIWCSLQLKGGSTAPDTQNLSVCEKDSEPNFVFYHHRKTAARTGCTPVV